jgi:hypothetical protein
VVLTHRNLDRHGEGWQDMRDAVSGGWSLTHYAEVAADGASEPDQPGPSGGRTGGTLPPITDDEMRDRLTKTRDYAVVLLRVTDRLVRPAVDPIIWEHGRRNFALGAQGIMPIVLPATDGSDWAGVAVLDVPAEQAAAIMAEDPAVTAGLMTYEVHSVRGFPGSALP